MMHTIDVTLTGKHEMEEAWQSPFVVIKKIIAKSKNEIPPAWQSRIQEKKIIVSIETPKKNQEEASLQMQLVWKVFQDDKGWRQKTSEQDKELVLFLDHLQDPHNVGNVIRTAHFFGACCVVIPSVRGAKLGETVIRTSSGAALSIPIVYGMNLVRSMQNFQKQGFYIWGLSPHVESVLANEDQIMPKTGLVIGSEGQGLARLTEKTCDGLYRLSNVAHRDSLNASSAAAIAIYACSEKLFAKG